jgi:hypothetical protein
MKYIRAFYLGLKEFRSCVVTGYEFESKEFQVYEYAREWIHKITLRKFEP